MAQRNKINALKNAFANDDFFQLLIDQLNDEAGDAELAYLSWADKSVRFEIAAEIERRIALGVHSNAIGGIGIAYRNTNVSVGTPELVVDVSAIRKELGRRKKDFPNSINQAFFRPTMERGSLVLQVVTASLIFNRDGLDAPRLMNATAAQSVALPSDEWANSPDIATISRVVNRFKSAYRDLRKLSSLAAQAADKAAWARLRGEAQIIVWQIDVIVPAKRLIVAFGSGKEIFQHALTGPEAHSKRLGKNGLTRDILLHRIWGHALTTSRPAPPLIKL